MIRSINYSVSAADVMHNPDIKKRLELMKSAGVTDLWLYGYFYGHYESDQEIIWKAKARLEDEGFDTGVISLPVGHPGNSLDPTNPDISLKIKDDWRYRVDKYGQKEYYISCINENMVQDNLEAAKVFSQMGFTRHFFDDDLRSGNHGEEIGGCFCDSCMEEFSNIAGRTMSRTEVRAAIESKTDNDIKDLWIKYICSKLTGFMKSTYVPGMKSGIMVMHKGGVKHGISIPDIKKEVPGCMFRVGELHFDDESYENPDGRISLIESVREHMSLIDGNPAYSETTVFPANALKPDNLIDKIKIELSCGLENIFLMSGTWFLEEAYWQLLAAEKQFLKEYNDSLYEYWRKDHELNAQTYRDRYYGSPL